MKIFAMTLILALASLASAQTAVAPTGTGISGDPYQIDSLPNLRWVSENSSAWGANIIQTSDIDASETSTWNSGAGFSPIGNEFQYFTGSYNGKGHVIQGVFIHSLNSSYAALFGGISGLIDSLGLVGGSVTSDYQAGGIAGENFGTISNCYNTASITSGRYTKAGGIASVNNGVITNCYNTGSVTSSSTGANATGTNASVGGIVAWNNGSISNCYNKGSVTSIAPFISTWAAISNAGGIVGTNNTGTISNCYNTGAVSANEIVNSTVEIAFTFAGGIVGFNTSTVSFSYNTGSISANAATDAAAIAGGIAGKNSSAGVISNNYNTGSISANAGTGGVAGGIAGENFGAAIGNCYNTGAVTASSDARGIVVYSYGSTISDCYNNTDMVSASGGGTGLNTSEMMDSTKFAGWDFETIWTIYPGQTYPLLRGFLKTLVVSAKDSTRTYDGTAFNGGKWTYSVSVVDSLVLGSLVFAGSSQGAIDAGSYTVNPSSLYSSQVGYLISYAPGTLTIAPKTITITGVTASDKVYDGNNTATLTGGTLDTITGDVVTLNAGTGTFADKNVGTSKVVTATGYSISGTDAANYTLSAQPTGLTANITPYPITVTAESVVKNYGDTDPAFTYTATPLLASDTLTGALTRAMGDTAGTYSILLGTLSAGSNYSITFVGANFTINPQAPVAITPFKLVNDGFVHAVPGGILVQGLRGHLDVMNLFGQRVAQLNVTGDGTYALNVAKGVYVVRNGMHEWKIER